MQETISVRIPKKELKEIEKISKEESRKKSDILRDVLKSGIKEKKLEIALDKFQKNEATAWKAARISEIPLPLFLDILAQRGIEFHYDEENLLEDFEEMTK